MKKIGASFIFAVIVSAAFAQTNTPATRPLSLQDCFASALQNNFDVRIERFNPEISQFNVSAAYSGYDPSLSFSGEHTYKDTGAYFDGNQLVLPTEQKANNFNTTISGGTPWGMTYDLINNISQQHTRKSLNTNSFNFADSSSGNVGVNVTQPLLKNFWIDNNRLNILVAKTQLKISEQILRNQVITTVTAVENAYYELIYAFENVKVQQDALTLAQTQLDQDKQRVQVGSLAPLDVQQDEAQVAESRASLIAAENILSKDQNVLKNLITDSYSVWHEKDIQPTASLEAPRQLFDVQDSWSKGMTQRPDLQQAKLNLEQQGIQLKYFRNQLYPEIDFVGSYGFNGAGRQYNDSFQQMNDGSRPYYSYGGQISIPLSNTKARNQLKAGKATEKQLLLQLKQLEQNVMVQIDDAVKQAQSAWESAEATRQARIYAEAALDAEQKKYAVGKSTTFTVLQLQNSLTTARSNEIRSLADYNQALANLAAAEGSTLQRRNLENLGQVTAMADAEKNFRIGSVPYLNAAPLTRDLPGELIFAPPSKLAEMLRRDELDAALVSITEVLLNDRYDILDGIAIASLGEVYSVLLAHKKPLTEVKEIFCDTASLTSVNLLKVLLAEKNLFPKFLPLENYAAAKEKDFVLLIGDPAIEFQRTPHEHEIFDLGYAWSEMTNLPFVYAVWALRRGIENKELRYELRAAKRFGMETLDYLIETRPEFDEDFRRDYFEWHIQYHLGEDEKRAIAKFCELLRKHNLGPVFEPKFVS